MSVVITGSIGSGKSTLLNAIKEHRPQYIVRSVDEAVRSSYNEPDINWQMRSSFLSKDRKTVSDLVFSSPSNIQAVNRVMMPHLTKVIEPWFLENDTIIEMPLYFESWSHLPFLKLTRPYTCVITIACDDKLRLERVIKRDSMTEHKFNQIKKVQTPQDVKIALSNAVMWVDNDSTVEYMLEQFDSIMEARRAQGWDISRFF